jgi:hypothetical protein
LHQLAHDERTGRFGQPAQFFQWVDLDDRAGKNDPHENSDFLIYFLLFGTL